MNNPLWREAEVRDLIARVRRGDRPEQMSVHFGRPPAGIKRKITRLRRQGRLPEAVPNHGRPWTPNDAETLEQLVEDGVIWPQIAAILGRDEEACRRHWAKLLTRTGSRHDWDRPVVRPGEASRLWLSAMAQLGGRGRDCGRGLARAIAMGEAP